jgi:thymidylate synthase (FAD)
MKIIEPSFTLSTPYSEGLNRTDGVRMLRFIEAQGRISHRSEDKQTLESWEKFIPAVVVGHGDWSICEHASITATIRTDRGITHEIVRHRLFAFTQESTRFVRNAGEMEFVRPIEQQESEKIWFEEVLKFLETSYHAMLKTGNRPQEARSILPNSLAATIAVTGNLRSWRWWFLARTTKETHPDFRRVSVPMLEQFKQIVPILYDDIQPEARQIDNARKAH